MHKIMHTKRIESAWRWKDAYKDYIGMYRMQAA